MLWRISHWGASRRKAVALRWKVVRPCPEPRLDAGAVQIGNRLYVIAGYTAQDTVSAHVDVFDFQRRCWTERIDLAPGVAHSHLAFATDGARFIYVVSGQYGPHCAPAVRDAVVLDTETRVWRPLPPLPEPRYAATMQFWAGRLHVMGGSHPDRYTPSTDHWSIAVDAGIATDPAWRRETPIPNAVCHHGSAVVAESLYLFGGQAGDFMAISESPTYECTGRTLEIYFPDVHRLRIGASQWERLPNMPIPVSHIEAAVLRSKSTVILCGGQTYKDPETFELELTDAIQSFDTVTGEWRILGRLPYRVKTVVAAHYNDWIYVFAGQRDIGPLNPAPGSIVNHGWRASLAIR